MSGHHADPTFAEPPRARSDDLLERRVTDDLVVYDLRSHRAHSLDSTAASLWRWCDGTMSVPTLCRRLGRLLNVSAEEAEPVVVYTLRRLAEADLLASPSSPDEFGSYDRRRCLAALVALPVVAGILVPTAADAQSLPAGSPCSSSSQCTTGCCNSASNRCTGGGPSCL